MKAKYGLPYMGSKDMIADKILTVLPNGNRFVDLFGGGGAMSHAASFKYNNVLYNELKTDICKLFKDAIDGKFVFTKNIPQFVDRETFLNTKDSDAFIRLVWSFGTNEYTYMYGKDKEKDKLDIHNAIVNNILSDNFKTLFPGFVFTETDIMKRHKELYDFNKRIRSRFFSLQQHLMRIERINLLVGIKNIEISNMNYKDYEYKDGDIVYCDPPYESTDFLYGGFNSQEFYDWVYSRPYQVWFSSYKISDNRFRIIWEKPHRSHAGQSNIESIEYIYTNK